MIKTGLGQDSHRFVEQGSNKPLMLGGVRIPGERGLEGNSDADVVLHAITNAVSGISGVNILGSVSDALCFDKGIVDSSCYLSKALETLEDYGLVHLSISIEAQTPRLAPHIEAIRESVARVCTLTLRDVGVTATSGEGLTSCGRGEGIAVMAIATAERV